MARLSILLADDHTMVRQGLRRVLEECPEWDVVAEANDGRDAVSKAEKHRPDVAVVDIAMPLLNGIEATRQISRKSPSTRVLMLSMHADDVYVAEMMRAGASGYLLKDSADVDLIRAVGELAHGRSFFSPTVAQMVRDHYVRHLDEHDLSDSHSTLSTREREVLQLVAEGKTNKDIAALLCISPSTVETHRAHIMEKLDLHSAAEIVLYAARRGIIR